MVHLDVPENIMNGKFKASSAVWAPHQYRQTDPLTPTVEEVARAAGMLVAAEAPMIHTGSVPASVTSIGDGAFQGCTNLASVTILSPTPPAVRYSGTPWPGGALSYNFDSCAPVSGFTFLWEALKAIKLRTGGANTRRK